MRIIEKRPFSVVVEGKNHYRSTVFLQGDGKWRCLRCHRYHCEHAFFVGTENPELPESPALTNAEVAGLIDE